MILRHSAPTGRCLLLLHVILIAASCQLNGVNAVGINYGTVANDLPPPAQVVSLLKTTYFKKVKLYEADPTILSSFAGSGYEVIVGVTNDLIEPMSGSQSFAQQWVTANVAPFYPDTNITVIAVGNEVLTTDQNATTALVPAMQNLQTSLVNLGLSDSIRVSTPHSFAVLDVSYPPSNGTIQPGFVEVFTPMLAFLSQTGGPFMINAYPYFAYADNPAVDINYALFQPNAGVLDSGSGLCYTNLFDAQVDAAYAALNKLGYQNIPLVVSESGWPSSGDPTEVGTTMANAQMYNSNLLKHLYSNSGTPAKPGVQIDTYLFALFNENLKPWPFSEQNFGLFYPNETMVYNVGIQMNSPVPAAPSPYTEPPAPYTEPTPAAPAPYTEPTPAAPAPYTEPPPAPPAPYTPVPWAGPTIPSPPPYTPVPWAGPTIPSPPPPLTIIPAPPPPYPVPQNPLPLPAPPPPSQFSPPFPPAGIPAAPPQEMTWPPPPVYIVPPPPFTAPPPPSFWSPPPSTSPGVPPYFPLPTPPTPSAPEPSAPAIGEPTVAPPGVPPATPGTPSGPNTWCVAKADSSTSDLDTALNYACGEGEADCTQIQAGQPCFNPDTLLSHASFAFDAYYAMNGRNYWNCYFGNVSEIIVTNPSYASCVYP